MNPTRREVDVQLAAFVCNTAFNDGRRAELEELEAFADKRLEALNKAGLTDWENGVWELKLELMRRLRELKM
jgi:hypothetical protein